MLWQVGSLEQQRLNFVYLAQQDGINMNALCRDYGFSTKTGYKWLNRYRAGAERSLAQTAHIPRRKPQPVRSE